MSASGIYAILNLFNDKLYIGSAKSIKGRFSWHYRALENNNHHSILLQRAWLKYGEDSFIFFVIERTDWLLYREQYWMDRFTSYNFDCGYNLYSVAGSPAKSKLSAEHKLKISLAGKGRVTSEETKLRMAEAARNRSDEWKANHSAAMKKRVFSAEHRRKLVEANARVKDRKILTKSSNRI